MSYIPPNPNGVATSANSAPVVTASDDANLKGFAASSAGGYIRQDSNATIAKETGGNLATIATNTGNSATAANQTNGNQQTKLTDGTNAANVNAGDFGGVVGNHNTKTLSFTTSSSGAQTLLTNTDCSGYASLTLVITSTGTGLSYSMAFSPTSGGTYSNMFSNASINTDNGVIGLVATVNVPQAMPVVNRFMEINVSALTSGTFSGYLILSTKPHPFSGTLTNISQVGGSTVSTAATGIMKVGLTDSSGNALNSTSNALNVEVENSTLAVTQSSGPWSENLTEINGNSVTTVANGTQAVGINDGTNTANVVAGDTGFNGVVVNNGTKTYSFSTSATGAQTILANTPTEGYATVEIVYTSVGAGLGITGGQFSATNGGTYVSSANFASGTSGFSGALGTTVNTIYTSPVKGNFFQIAVSALTSGTFAGTVTLRANPPQSSGVQASQTGTWTVGSNSATGSAVPANAFYMAGASVGGNLTGVLVDTDADAASSKNSMYTLARGELYNGSTWDRLRSANAASNTTGTGLLGTGMLAYDGTDWQYVQANLHAPAKTQLNTYEASLSAASTTVTASTAFISSLILLCTTGQTLGTITVEDVTNSQVLVDALAATAAGTTPTTLNFQTPIKMAGGFKILLGGSTAPTVSVWANYYQ